MRSYGASIADMALLLVAADDGVISNQCYGIQVLGVSFNNDVFFSSPGVPSDKGKYGYFGRTR